MAMTTSLQTAKTIMDYLNEHGLKLPDETTVLAEFTALIDTAQNEARREERRRVTADWLAEVVPGEVLQMAADKVSGREF